MQTESRGETLGFTGNFMEGDVRISNKWFDPPHPRQSPSRLTIMVVKILSGNVHVRLTWYEHLFARAGVSCWILAGVLTTGAQIDGRKVTVLLVCHLRA